MSTCPLSAASRRRVKKRSLTSARGLSGGSTKPASIESSPVICIISASVRHAALGMMAAGLPVNGRDANASTMWKGMIAMVSSFRRGGLPAKPPFLPGSRPGRERGR